MTGESKLNTKKLECKLKRKKKSFVWRYYLGFYSIIILSIIDQTVTAALNSNEQKDGKDSIPFEQFKVLWSILLIIAILKFYLHLYSIFLIWNSTRVMQRVAESSGNPGSTKDIKYITLVGVLCFLAFIIQMLGYLSITILQASNVLTGDTFEAQAVYKSVTAFVLFIAYAMLINIFWTYVININKSIEGKPSKDKRRISLRSNTTEQTKFYKLSDDNETLDGDLESREGAKLNSRLINTNTDGMCADTNAQNLTEESDQDSDLEYDSEDEDLTREDKRLRKEILKNFIAGSKANKQSTGRYTNMRMTLPQEDQRYSQKEIFTPNETE